MTDAGREVTTDFGLVWGLKASFLRYLRSVGGAVQLGGGAAQLDDGRFYLPSAGTADAEEGACFEAAFRGALHFYAHFGLLDFAVEDVRVHVDVATRSGVLRCRGLAGHEQPGALALLQELTLVEGDAAWRVVGADVRLAADAVDSFGGVYEPGTALDLVDLRIPRR